jgi:sugar-phosphatase
VDGVLVDSMAVYRRVWSSWSVVCGLDPEAVWALTPGRRPADTIEAVAPHLDLSEEIRRLTGLLDSELENLPAMPGAAELLTSIPPESWALVTSNTTEVVLACFRRLRLPIPRLVVDGEAVEFGKPHPEGFLRAASCLGVAPTHCLVIEDAAAGVAAARSAGMAVFGIASTESPERLAAADRVFESLRDATPAVQLWLQLPDCAAQSQQSG